MKYSLDEIRFLWDIFIDQKVKEVNQIEGERQAIWNFVTSTPVFFSWIAQRESLNNISTLLNDFHAAI